MHSRLSSASGIAIAGMACRFPGNIGSPDDLWRLLVEGRSAIGGLPPTRFLAEAVYDPDAGAPGLSYSKWGGFLSDIAGFDHGFFEISPREAEAMDPQQRLLLMVAYEAMENAGLTRARLEQARTGVFVGVSASEYANLQRYRRTHGDAYTGTGAALSIVANRISHRFNLRGPSFSVDTACSSSLVALDQAVKSLERGDCDIAIVGGANVLSDFGGFVAFSKANMLSPTGVLAAFDARANGYVRGEGIGAVVLTRMGDARAEGLRVLARIRATEVNQDGRTTTLTAPNPLAQRKMLETVCRHAQIDPADVAYVEAHGTGTPVGDPIEASAIGHVFGGDRRRGPLLMGSVKPNIGHLEPAAGIAGLIKAVLVAQHGQVPANVNFVEPNPDIAFDAFNMAVPMAVTPIGEGGEQTLIAVNSFGFGGTNASVLLEALDEAKPPAPVLALPHPVMLPISAGSAEALARVATGTADVLQSKPQPVDALARALASQDPKPLRKGLVAGTAAELVTQLRSIGPDTRHGNRLSSEPKLAFAYGGQGAQWWGMGRRLLAESAAFAGAFDSFESAFSELSGWSVRKVLSVGKDQSTLHLSKHAMPALFGLQMGLGAYWSEHGIVPAAVLGHSFGEVAAAVFAGAISLNDAARLIYVRCQIRDLLGRDSAMLAIGIDAEALPQLLPEGAEVDITARNAPGMITVGGETADIEALYQTLQQDHPRIFVRRVQSDTAWHTRLLEPLEAWFRESLGSVDWRIPHTPFISTVTGQPEVRLDADYWWRNLREPVRYAAAVEESLRLGCNVLLELSPHRVLTPSNLAIAEAQRMPLRAAASLVREQDDWLCVAQAQAELFEAGIDVDPVPHMPKGVSDIRLPPYSWDLAPHWRMPEEAKRLLLSAPAHHLLGRREPLPGYVWHNEIDLVGYSLLAGHAVGDSAVFPAAGHIELMLAAGREALGAGTIELQRFAIHAALFIGAEDQLLLATTYDPRTGLVSVQTRRRGGGSGWTLRAQAVVRLTDAPVAVPIEEPIADEDYDGARFYAETERLGFRYGGAFRGVRQVGVAGNRAVAAVSLPATAPNPVRHYLAHPAMLDAALQAGLVFAFAEAGEERLFLPTTIDRLRCSIDLPTDIKVVVEQRASATGRELEADFTIYDEHGVPLLSIERLGMRQAALPRGAADADEAGARLVREVMVQLDAPAATMGPASDDLLVCDADLPGCVAVADVAALIAAGRQQGEPPQRLVFISPPMTGDNVADALSATTQSLVRLGQSLRRIEGPIELLVVTRGARLVAGGGPMDADGLAQAPLVGLTRTLASELAHVRVRQVDIAPGAALDGIDRVSAYVDEDELVLREDAVWAPRLEFVADDQLERRVQLVGPGSCNYALTMTAPGSLSALQHVSRDVPEPAHGEVLVETAAVGLNFRDVMAATGLLPAQAERNPAWQNLGLEFSGLVRAVGDGVEGFRPGDRVFGMGKAAMQAFSIRPATSLTALPAGLGLDDAAAIGSAFATAQFALHHAGRLRSGERVLIHLGTGGVGLAAIQIAQAAGAEIFATAGSEHKRQYLRDLGVAHVMDSRSLVFADQIMVATGGEGVDVVLNSLSGSAQIKSIEVLKPFGRFLEIGKRDVYEDRPLGLQALARNISLHVIDLAAMEEQRPELLATLFNEVMAGFAAGTLRPLPITVFKAAEAEQAFRLMSQARHIGKVVISYRDDPVPVRISSERLEATAEEVYLVSGGTSGFGASVAAWLAGHGAGTILVASRRGQMSEELAKVAEDLAADGAIIRPVALDVSDGHAVSALFASLARAGTPLSGIVHAAAVFHDGMLEQLTPDDVQAVLDSKAVGAWNLHRAAVDHGFALKVFCTFSSIAETIGSIGQANYVAANSFLEALTTYRRGLGLAAHTIAWGPLGDAGVVARNEAMRSYLSSVGLAPVTNADALAALDVLLTHDAANLVFASADWSRVGRRPDGSLRRRFEALVSGRSSSSKSLWNQLDTLAPQHWPGFVERILKQEIARVLKLEPEEIAAERSLTELGFDSLSSIELKNRLENLIGQPIPLSAFMGSPSLTQLAAQILALAQERTQTATTADEDSDVVAEQGDDQKTARRDRAYWAARFGRWPAALAFPGRRQPLLAGSGPLRQGPVSRLSAAVGTASESRWLLSFAESICDLTGRTDIAVIRHAAAGSMAVRIEKGQAVGVLDRHLRTGADHLGVTPAQLESLFAKDLARDGAWLGQIGFSYGQPSGADVRHELHLILDDGRITLAFDRDSISEQMARRLLSGIASRMPVINPETAELTEQALRPTPASPEPPRGIALGSQARALLASIEDAGASAAYRRAWTLSQAMQIAPQVDIDRLREAAAAIEARHESLRVRFADSGGARSMMVRPASGGRVFVHEVGSTATDPLVAARAIAERPILPTDADLFEVHLLRFDGFDVVLIKLFELVADGWSLALVCDELIRAYLGLDLGPAPLSLDAAQALLARPPAEGSPAGSVDDEPPFANRLGHPAALVLSLDAGSRAAMRERATKLGSSENALLAAAYAKALSRLAGLDELSMSIIQPGRDVAELQNFVGFVRQTHSILVRDLKQASLRETAAALGDAFLATAAVRGSTAHRAGAFGYARLLPDQVLSSTLMGTLAGSRESGFEVFSLAVEPLDLGTFGLQEHELHLRPLSRGEELELHFHFDRDVYSRSEIEGLAGRILSQLGLAGHPDIRQLEPQAPA